MSRDPSPASADGTATEGELVDGLFDELYDELRALAARAMRDERSPHTLQPTAIVHEAWLRLVRQRRGPLSNRAWFRGAAAAVIRRVLIDHARKKGRRKRGEGRVRITLAPDVAAIDAPDLDLLALDEALAELAARDPRQARIVEQRFFGGSSIPEVAASLGLSTRTVEQEWTFARAYLSRALDEGARGHRA